MLGSTAQAMTAATSAGISPEWEHEDMIDDVAELATVEEKDSEGVMGWSSVWLLSKDRCGVYARLSDSAASAPARESSCDGVTLLL
jgi:hypothetical protein